MKDVLQYIFPFILLITTGLVSAQQIKPFASVENTNSPEENLALANDLYNIGAFYSADKLYREVLAEQADNDFALYQHAHTQRLLRNYQEAGGLYQKIISKNISDYMDAPYWFGISLESQGRYDEALQQFEAASPGKGVTEDMIRHKITSVEFARNVRSDDDNVRVSMINFNKPAFGVYPMGDNVLLFTGVDRKLVRRKVQYGDRRAVYDTIYANKVYEGKFNGKAIAEETPLKLRMDDDALSHGSASLAPGNNRMYFSVCGTLEGNNDCSIFLSDRRKDGWSDPVRVKEPVNAPGYSSKHPMVIKEGEDTFLFFSSNRPGGSGGYDLWYSKISPEDTHGQPVNLGKSVNTKGDEVTPYYDTASNTLFFSSNGYPGLGQLDVYLVQLDKVRSGGSLVHLGKPVNSSADDYYFSVFNQGRKGYLSSNRGAAHDKIYLVDFKETFSYKRLSESMAELRTLEEADGDFPLFKESFAYKALASDGDPVSLMEERDVSISGTLASQGMPGANKTVMLVDDSGIIVDTTTADENGYFEFRKLPDDQNYSLMFLEKDAPVNFSVDFKNTTGEVLKTVRSEDDPSSFSYRRLTDSRTGISPLTASDGEIAFPEENIESLFTPAMSYEAYQAIENKFFDHLKERINLRVQVGAYRRPSPGLYDDLALNYPVERVIEDGLTKFQSGNFKKLKEAEEQRKKAFDQGIKDAFIAVYFKGKRIAILLYW